MKKFISISTIFIVFLMSCQTATAQNPYKAPLYWSVYEHHILKDGVVDNYISETDFQANIDWVDQNLKSYGYKMICVDGWGDVSQTNSNGYRTNHSRHWTHNYAWWSEYLQTKGMTLGMYDNPLWVHVDPNNTTTKIVGTNINVSSLMNTSENALWFKWVQVNRLGAEEYVKGYVKHYADMGIKYLRVDFLSWFETGTDKNLGTVGVNRPRADYEKALRWMREACDAHGIFLSLVMPHLKEEAALEKQYGHMVRVNEDVGSGGWGRFSDLKRGIRYSFWSQYENAFDGLTYWSAAAGRNKLILDGDFIRLNTFKTDNEKRTVISAHLMAGAPLSIADQYNTIGNDLWVYQNSELLALNTDKFVGKPLENNPNIQDSQIWTGQMSNGDWIVGLFNRENTTVSRTFAFSSLGLTDSMKVRDLWQHADLGKMKSLSIELPPHGCLIVKLTNTTSTCTPQNITFNPIPNKMLSDPDFTPVAISSSGLPVSFEIGLGTSATMTNNNLHLTGTGGQVFVVAKQSGNANICAAMPVVQSFEVASPHQSAMYVAGTFSNWSLGNNPMTLTNGVWVARNIAITQGNHELKFANTNNWTSEDWGNATGLVGTAKRATGGAPNIKFTIATTGQYDIYFNDLNLAYSIGSPLTASQDLDKEVMLSIYPNPTHGILNINAKQSIDTVNLIDLTGKTILSKTVNNTTISLDVAHLAKGIYFVQVIKGGKWFTEKVVLE